MLAIQPFVQHSSSLSLSPLPAFRTHFWIHSRLGLVFKVFISLLFFFLSTCTYLTVMLHFLFVGLCHLAFRSLPSAGLCCRFRLLLCPIWPIWPPLAIGSVPPPHAVTIPLPSWHPPSIMVTPPPHGIPVPSWQHPLLLASPLPLRHCPSLMASPFPHGIALPSCHSSSIMATPSPNAIHLLS